jgi:hypothetical protein
MKKTVLRKLLLSATLVLGLTSCSDDDKPIVEPPVTATNGFYVLTQGTWGTNSGALYFYDIEKKEVTEAFKAANGIQLGDLPQDMLIYGSKMYIAVSGSGIIYVTDKNAKIIATIKDDAQKISPRHLDAANGKVYVSLWEGYLAQIDTVTLEVEKKIAVGLNPEYVKVVNNKVYVANSGGDNWQNGYDKTVSVVDLNLTSKKDIQVAMNPYQLAVDKYNNLYLVSRGDYATTPYSLQQINTSTDAVTEIDKGRAYSVFPYEDKLYILNHGYDANYNPYSTFLYYDINSKKIVDESFITEENAANIPNDIASVSIEPVSGDYYVTASNSVQNGDVYIYSKDGKFKSKFDAGSSWPSGAWYITK